MAEVGQFGSFDINAQIVDNPGKTVGTMSDKATRYAHRNLAKCSTVADSGGIEMVLLALAISVMRGAGWKLLHETGRTR
jgi:hypothetical protein